MTVFDAEAVARRKLENNGRNTANSNAGIRVGSDLHLCEMLLKQIDTMRVALRAIEGMPATMANDSDSLRHTIKTIQQIARTAVTTGEREP